MSSPFSKVRIPKPPKKVIATFSDKQLAAMLKAINTATPAGFRDWTIMLMLLDTGLRASELVGLTIDNVNLEDGIVKVLGKGSKERIVPFGAKVQRTLWKYLQKYRPQPANPRSPTLFLTASGNPLTTDRLRTIIEKYARRAGIEGIRCSPHTFRHTFAISYLRNGGDVFTAYSIDVLRSNSQVISARAREELGFTARPWQDSIRDHVEWFRAEGMLPKRR